MVWRLEYFGVLDLQPTQWLQVQYAECLKKWKRFVTAPGESCQGQQSHEASQSHILHVRVTHTTFGSETWTLIQADLKWLDSFHMRCQRRILHISWHDFISKFYAVPACSKLHLSYANEDWVFSATLPTCQALTCCTGQAVPQSLHQGEGRWAAIPEMALGDVPAAAHLTTWIHQIYRDTYLLTYLLYTLASRRLRPRSWRTTNRSGRRSQRREASPKGAITSKIKHAIKHKTKQVLQDLHRTCTTVSALISILF